MEGQVHNALYKLMKHPYEIHWVTNKNSPCYILRECKQKCTSDILGI